MFRCRMNLNWAVEERAEYEHNPIDSKYLTRAGAALFETMFGTLDDSTRIQVLGDAEIPTVSVPLPGGGNEGGVSLDGIRAEIQRRLNFLMPHGWTLSVDDEVKSPENHPIPYKYRIDPPECCHTLLVWNGDQQLFVEHSNSTARGLVVATLDFWEVDGGQA